MLEGEENGTGEQADLTPAGTGESSGDAGDGALRDDHADGSDKDSQGQEDVGAAGSDDKEADAWEPMAEGWRDHPDVKQFAVDERAAASSDAQSRSDRQVREVRAEHVTALETAKAAGESTAAITKLSEVIKGYVDQTEEISSVEEAEGMLNRVLDDPANRAFAGVFDANAQSKYTSTGKQEGFRLARNYLSKGLPAALTTEMEAEDRDVTTAIKLGEIPTWEAAFDKLLAARDTRIRADERTKVEGDRGSREDAEERNEGRPKSLPDTSSGRGGARRVTLNELSKMNRIEIAALPEGARDRALESANR